MSDFDEPDFNEKTQVGETGLYRRAIRCLAGSTDPLKDLTTDDMFRVLGILSQLRESNAARRLTILYVAFKGKAEAMQKYYEVVEEMKRTGRLTAFGDDLHREARLMWDEVLQAATDRPEVGDGPRPAPPMPEGTG